jgi:hypothetical protein
MRLKTINEQVFHLIVTMFVLNKFRTSHFDSKKLQAKNKNNGYNQKNKYDEYKNKYR